MQTKAEATVEDLYHAPDDGNYEIVDGRLVYMPPTGDEPNYAAAEVFASLREYVRKTGKGRARTDGVAYIVDLPNRKSFSPDASYSLHFRPRNMRFVEGAPLFAVEVRSESDYGRAADRAYARKRSDYFAAGTRIVWDIDPIAKTVTAYRDDAPDQPVIFRSGDIADAEPLLPGWGVAVDDLFSDE
jgi:Uma2 family endonuclease